MYLLGIDIGTSSAKCVLADRFGKVRAVASRDYPLSVPRPGWAEQEAGDWEQAMYEGIRQLLSTPGISAGDIDGISFSGQMHGLVALDREGRVIRKPFLAYREGGANIRDAWCWKPEKIARPNRWHVLEVEFPDDARRYFGVHVYAVNPLTGGITGGQLCLTNPEVRKLLQEKLLASIAAGEAAAKKAVCVGLAAIVSFVVMLQISLAFAPSANDIAAGPMKEVFALTPRVCIASVTLYFLANILDIHLYHFIKAKVPGRMWFRNNAATITCQAVQAFFFCFAAFYGTFPVRMILELSLTTVLIELVTLPVFLWLTPYLNVARAEFYNLRLRRQMENSTNL